MLGGLSHEARAEGREEEASALCSEALRICDDLGIEPLVTLVSSRGLLRILRGDLEGESDVRDAAERYLDLGNPYRAAGTLWELSADLSEWTGAAANPAGEEAIQLCIDRGVGNVDSLLVLTLLGGWQQGQWDEQDKATELADRAREAGRLTDESCALFYLGFVEVERTGVISAAPRLMELVESWEPTFWIASFGGALLSRSGERHVRSAGIELLESIASTEADPTWRLLYEEARAAISAGMPKLARRLVPDPGIFHRPQSRVDADAASAAVAEMEGRWEDAATGYQASVDGLNQLGYFGSLIGPLIGLGRCLMKVERSEDALAKLGDAHRICERLRARVRIAEIDELLAAID